MRNKLVYGKGLYDLELPKTYKIDGVTYWKEPCYLRWERMLHRCYGESTKKDRPTYAGCEVCEEWLTFSNFKRWIESFDNWKNLHLDKDLLVGGCKLYSPNTCCMIEPRVNHFLTLRGNHRGDYPIGVTKNSNPRCVKKFVSRINVETGVRKSLGIYQTPALAHKAWQEAKLTQAKLLQSRQTCERTKLGLQRVIDKLTNHIEQGVETKSL